MDGAGGILETRGGGGVASLFHGVLETESFPDRLLSNCDDRRGFFFGEVAEVAVYDVALSYEEIHQLYQQGPQAGSTTATRSWRGSCGGEYTSSPVFRKIGTGHCSVADSPFGPPGAPQRRHTHPTPSNDTRASDPPYWYGEGFSLSECLRGGHVSNPDSRTRTKAIRGGRKGGRVTEGGVLFLLSVVFLSVLE